MTAAALPGSGRDPLLSLAGEPGPPEESLELVHAEGTLEEVGRLAERYAADAKQELEFFPPSDARDALEFAPDFLLHRRS